MTNDDVVIPYKMNVLLADKKDLHIDRSTVLPANYQAVFNAAVSANIKTYGDLAFISQMDPTPDDISAALDQIQLMGFDMSVLKRIV